MPGDAATLPVLAVALHGSFQFKALTLQALGFVRAAHRWRESSVPHPSHPAIKAQTPYHGATP
jgi:hypothetical protein